MSRRLPLILWVLLLLFILRVFGQLLVTCGWGAFLPPMEEWFSGVVPYPKLLFAQLVIVILYGKICVDFTRNRGFFVIPRHKLGSSLLVFGALYLGVMIVRYVIRMALYPHERWMGGCIPIFFHWVLATFLLVLGNYHWKLTRHERHDCAKLPRWVRGALGSVFIILVSSGILFWIAYQLAPTFLAYQFGFRRPEFAVRIERKLPLKTSDGADLFS